MSSVITRSPRMVIAGLRELPPSGIGVESGSCAICRRRFR
jgi:hypothetical protein